MEAAAMEATVASPLTMQCAAQGRSGGSLPSTSARSGGQRPAQGLERRLADVEPVDGGGRGRADADLSGGEDRFGDSLSPRRRERLRIGEPLRDPPRVEHHGRRHHGSGERPAPDLVKAGDGAVAAALQLALACEFERDGGHRG
jgi:hypothetical protein